MDTSTIQRRLRDFAAERDWEQFHSPKNLVMALGAEVGELTELFQWMTEKQSRTLNGASPDMTHVREEIADVMIYLLRLADVLNVDLEGSIDAKITLNEERYSVELSRGTSRKHSRR